MSQPIHPDDPVLTAYVLGELPDGDRAAVEAHLTSSPESRRAVEELQGLSAQLFEALQFEPAPALTDAQRQAIRAAAINTSPRVATRGHLGGEQRVRDERSRKRAAMAALLAVVTVSAAVVAVIALPPTHGVPAHSLDQKMDLLALNTDSLTRFYTDPTGGRFDEQLAQLSTRSPHSGPRSLIVMQDSGQPAESPAQLGEQAAVASAASGPTGHESRSLTIDPEASERSGPTSAAIVASSPAGTVGGGGIGGGAGGSPPASGPVIVESFARQPSSESAPTATPLNRWSYFGADGVEVPAGSPPSDQPVDTNGNGVVELRQLTEGAPASARPELQTQSQGQLPMLGKAVATPLLAANGAAPATPQVATTFGLETRQWGRQATHLDVQFRQGSFEFGGFQSGDATVMSNSVTPRTELLYETLRRGRRLEERELKWRKSGLGTEAYTPIVENPFVSPVDQPLSTFGLDVDTASYSNVRRFLRDQQCWPPADAVRLEEMINYFAYDDPQPEGEHPLAVTLEAAACPWAPAHRLVRIGVKGREIDHANRPATSLVFLIDTSGSMRDENKLPLVKNSLRLLVSEMTENDRIALVTYSTNAGLVLDSTSGEHREAILAVIDSLQASGSTNGEAGLKLAYDIASRHFINSGTNRVILCTDGDFNVGESADAPLVRLISEKRDTGVFLSICGYGTGNLKDAKLEQIADNGNGHYHYIDGIGQARKVFLEDLSGMLYTIAKDVKLQVEFNPAKVAAYRLIGYENRALAAQDFNNDRIDAGDLGAGHSVTALYEIVPAGADVPKPATEQPRVDPLKYQRTASSEQRAAEPDSPPTNSLATDSTPARLAATQREAGAATVAPQPSTELLTVKLRYTPTLPEGSRLNGADATPPDAARLGDANADASIRLDFPLDDNADAASPSDDVYWAAAVASFGMLLRNSAYRGQSSIEGVLELARGAKGDDPSGERQEFIELVLEARSIYRRATGTSTPPPRELTSLEAREKAAVGGRYRDLLDKFDRPEDFDLYGEFHDAGRKLASPDSQHPAGFWVYVYPHWYVWGETTAVSQTNPESTP
ncbi:MAG: von Willebrand factor type A domain-containing protein [Planctomycetaceae bacterium]